MILNDFGAFVTTILILQMRTWFQKIERVCLGAYGWDFPLVCPTAKSPSESESSTDAVEPEWGARQPAKEKRRREWKWTGCLIQVKHSVSVPSAHFSETKTWRFIHYLSELLALNQNESKTHIYWLLNDELRDTPNLPMSIFFSLSTGVYGGPSFTKQYKSDFVTCS